MKTCPDCSRVLPPAEFINGGQPRRTCRPCWNDARRAERPMTPLCEKRQRAEVRLLNVTNLWHGPVRRGVPLRSAA